MDSDPEWQPRTDVRFWPQEELKDVVSLLFLTRTWTKDNFSLIRAKPHIEEMTERYLLFLFVIGNYCKNCHNFACFAIKTLNSV